MTPRSSFSKGCLSCRRMKVKCDEARPACTRCVKAKRACSGYKEHAILRVQSMNDWAVSQKSGPYSHTNVPAQTVTDNPVLASVQPSIPLDQYAIACFVGNFSISGSAALPGYLTYLPVLTESSNECFHEALRAVSFSYLGNLSSNAELKRVSKHHYGRALHCLSGILGENSGIPDDVIMSAILLRKYELITGSKHPDSDPHGLGTAAMAKHKWRAKPRYRLGQNLYKYVQSMDLIEQAFHASHSSNKDAHEPSFGPYCPGNSLWTLIAKALACRAQLTKSIEQAWGQTNHTALTTLDMALQHASKVLNQLRMCSISLPEPWQYRTRSLPEVYPLDISTGLGLDSVFYFQSLQMGFVWTVFWCCCLYTLQDIECGYDLVSNNSGRTLKDAGAASREWRLEITDNILRSAPFMLGDVDEHGVASTAATAKGLGAFFLLKSLAAIKPVNNTITGQGKAALHYLDRIGTMFGIQTALNIKACWLAAHKTEP